MHRNLYFPGAKGLAFHQTAAIGCGQDGAMANGYVFRFDAQGNGSVYALDGMRFVCSFVLGGAERMVPHCNAVGFGGEYAEAGDEFPLLYANVYNNYSGSENRHEGTCCVYRITREGNAFSADLVQLIVIDFVDDPALWKSPNVQDIRPYGNFVIDAQNSELHAFVMRDEAHQTRFFRFRLPRLAEGQTVHLTPEHILDRFDAEYVNFMQGAAYHGGYIYSVEGFNADSDMPPALRVFDVNGKQMVFYTELAPLGLTFEPEFIEVYEDQLYYGDCEGNLYQCTFRA